MRLRPIDFRRLQGMIPPLEVLHRWGWRGHCEPSGYYRGPCPIHGSQSRRSRSFAVGAELVCCYKCGWWGDAVELHAWHERLPKLAAAYDLCALLHLSPPVLRR